MNYIFGPVPSRRLGYSLGVDPIPRKTCSFDCIYCEIGRTTHKTMERRPYLPIGPILEELQDALSKIEALDFVTVSGSGEPTLHSGLGELISGIKAITSFPVAVITNGSLFHEEAVRSALSQADVVIPSLDAVEESVYQVINRPVGRLSLSAIQEGLIAFRNSYAGKLWLEILLVRGINDNPGHLEGLRDFIKILGPDKVQLNTVIRPPVEDYAYPLTSAQLQDAQAILGDRVEIIANFSRPSLSAQGVPWGEEILDMIGRRPCTAQDLAMAVGIPVEEVISFMNQLIAEGKGIYEVFDRKGFYRKAGTS